jgi:hypothetical protein
MTGGYIPAPTSVHGPVRETVKTQPMRGARTYDREIVRKPARPPLLLAGSHHGPSVTTTLSFLSNLRWHDSYLCPYQETKVLSTAVHSFFSLAGKVHVSCQLPSGADGW